MKMKQLVFPFFLAACGDNIHPSMPAEAGAPTSPPDASPDAPMSSPMCDGGIDAATPDAGDTCTPHHPRCHDDMCHPEETDDGDCDHDTDESPGTGK